MEEKMCQVTWWLVALVDAAAHGPFRNLPDLAPHARVAWVMSDQRRVWLKSTRGLA